jgi:hypothetical protein
LGRGEPQLDPDWLGEQYVVVCETCDQVLVYADYQKNAEHLTFSQAELIWPEPDDLHHSVPDAVQRIYEEAMRIRQHAPNAYATQIRRALEALCEDRGMPKGTLHQRLQALSATGALPPLLSEMTDVLRILGNMGAHESTQQVRSWHVAAIEEFFKAVIEYIYVAPYKLDEFRQQLAAMHRNAPPAT